MLISFHSPSPHLSKTLATPIQKKKIIIIIFSISCYLLHPQEGQEDGGFAQVRFNQPTTIFYDFSFKTNYFFSFVHSFLFFFFQLQTSNLNWVVCWGSFSFLIGPSRCSTCPFLPQLREFRIIIIYLFQPKKKSKKYGKRRKKPQGNIQKSVIKQFFSFFLPLLFAFVRSLRCYPFFFIFLANRTESLQQKKKERKKKRERWIVSKEEYVSS